MTAPAEQSHAHAHGGARSEEDRISTGRIVAVGAASLLLFVVSGLAVSLYFQARMRSSPPLPDGPEVGRSKIGLVEQQPFAVARRGEADRAVRLERLGSYGWVDRREGIAHIPIERAMELVEKGVRARPGGEQESRNIGGQP
jgi:hypothetical protein